MSQAFPPISNLDAPESGKRRRQLIYGGAAAFPQLLFAFVLHVIDVAAPAACTLRSGTAACARCAPSPAALPEGPPQSGHLAGQRCIVPAVQHCRGNQLGGRHGWGRLQNRCWALRLLRAGLAVNACRQPAMALASNTQRVVGSRLNVRVAGL